MAGFDLKFMNKGEWKIGKLIKKEDGCKIQYNRNEFDSFSGFLKEILKRNIGSSDLQKIKFFFNNNDFISYMELSSEDSNFVKKKGKEKLKYLYDYLVKESERAKEEEDYSEIIEKIDHLSLENKLKVLKETSNKIK